MDHLLQLAHRLPQFLALDIDCGIVLVEFPLARSEPFKDRLDMALRRGIAVTIALQLVAEGDDPEQLAPAHLSFASGIKILNSLAQLEQIIAHASVLVHCPHRTVKETV